jgi:hypothetical protein
MPLASEFIADVESGHLREEWAKNAKTAIILAPAVEEIRRGLLHAYKARVALSGQDKLTWPKALQEIFPTGTGCNACSKSSLLQFANGQKNWSTGDPKQAQWLLAFASWTATQTESV